MNECKCMCHSTLLLSDPPKSASDYCKECDCKNRIEYVCKIHGDIPLNTQFLIEQYGKPISKPRCLKCFINFVENNLPELEDKRIND